MNGAVLTSRANTGSALDGFAKAVAMPFVALPAAMAVGLFCVSTHVHSPLVDGQGGEAANGFVIFGESVIG
jgi:hypothetical protein